jgi:oligoribonuclease NrnB/cAMP/cGMP phosphodiesterase (DHH superfamily)
MLIVMYVHIGEKYRNLDWFKNKIMESYIEDQQNIVYMTDYSIQPNELTLKLYNWCTDKKIEFYWIDHHITAIENLNHYNIPGLQHSAYSGCLNTWHALYGDETVPMCIRFANDFDIWNKKTEYSWDKQLYPLCYFMSSFNIHDLNNNESELVLTCKSMFEDNKFTDTCIQFGKYTYNYVLNEYKLANRKIYNIIWNDYNCLITNSSFKGSTQFEGHEDFDSADILITWTYTGKSFQYGLYTTKQNINVGTIASMFLNGGGHAGAAGRRNKRICIP